MGLVLAQVNGVFLVDLSVQAGQIMSSNNINTGSLECRLYWRKNVIEKTNVGRRKSLRISSLYEISGDISLMRI